VRRWAGLSLALSLVACSSCFRDPSEAPIVIAHRGASGERPEHTLEAYRLAIEQGADFIEVDLVATRDGQLIARHENELSHTTDISSRPEFADRRTRKRIDGREVTGWFSEDLSLPEIKTLRAVERIPEARPGNALYDGRFAIPTLGEIIALLREVEARLGKRVGLYAEIKHATWFAKEGTQISGDPIARSLGRLLIARLSAAGLTDSSQVFIQSFEVAPLLELQRELLPEAGFDLPLVQLLGDLGDPTKPFNAPHDFRAAGVGIEPELAECLAVEPEAPIGYADLVTSVGLSCMKQLYAEGIGPSKDTLMPRVAAAVPVDLDGDGEATIVWQQTGEVAAWLGEARALGLHVHPFTLRAEERFRSLRADGQPLSHSAEIQALLAVGATGIFTDHPGDAVAARDAFLRQGG